MGTFRTVLLLLLMFALLLSEVPSAKVFMTLDEALDLVFSGADRVERRSVFLTEEDVRAISARARAPLDSRLFVLYQGWKDERLMGTAMVDTHTLRTKTETILVLISPEGVVEHVEILAFYEPPDYMPVRGWLRAVEDNLLSDDLWVGRDVPNMTGATITANALVRAVRRVSAVYEEVSKGWVEGRAGATSAVGVKSEKGGRE